MATCHVKDVIVPPSGTMVILSFADANGDFAGVTSLITNAVQQAALKAGSGSFTLSFGGQTTAAISAGAVPSAVQSALEALTSIGTGNVAVSQLAPYRIEFQGTLAGASEALITGDGSGLAGPLPTVPTTLGTSAGVTGNIGSTGATKVGSAWKGSGFGTSFWYVPHQSSNLSSGNYAAVPVTGLAAGTYSIRLDTIDPGWLSGFDSGFSPATAQRVRLYDGTTLDTAVYRGEGSVNILWTGNVFGYTTAPVATVYCGSGTLWAVVADDADAGGDVAIHQVQADPPGTRFWAPAPTVWPLGNHTRSIALWFKPDALPASGTTAILFGYGNTNDVVLNSDGTISFNQGSGSLTTTGTLSVGTWAHIAVVYQGAENGADQTWDLYLNGVHEAGATNLFTSTNTTNAQVGVGTQARGGSYLDAIGTHGGLGVWSRTLSTTELTTLNTGGSAQTYAGLSVGLRSGLASYYDSLASYDGTDAKAAVPLSPLSKGAPSGAVGTPSLTISSLLPGGSPVSIKRNGVAETLKATVLWDSMSWAAFLIDGSPIVPTDSITATLAANAIQANSLDVDPITDAPATNHAGGTWLPTEPPASPALRVGYNVQHGYFSTPECLYSNIIKCAQDQFGNASWQGQGSDSNGYPTVAGTYPLIVNVPFTDIDPNGYPMFPWGSYTLCWDGAGTCSLATNWNSIPLGSEDTSKQKLTGAADNIRVYDYTKDPTNPAYSPELHLTLDNTTGSVSNVRLYPPGVLTTPGTLPADQTTIPKFNPAVLAQMSGCKCIRTMVINKVNGPTWIDQTDFNAETEYAWFNKYRSSLAYVTSLECYAPTTYGPGSFGVPNQFYVKVTTATPHGLKTGVFAWFNRTGSDPLWSSDGQQFLFTATDGSGTAGMWANGGTVYVIDSTTFVYGMTAGKAFNTPTFGANTVQVQCLYGGVPPADLCELVNALPDCDLWWNWPAGVTDTAVTAIAQTIASTLATGRTVYLELGNEPWNTFASFQAAPYAAVMGQNEANGPIAATQWIVLRSAQIRDLFKTAWTGAGRTEPVKLVLNAQVANPPEGQYLIDYAASHDSQGRPSTDPNYSGPIEFDGMAGAPYFEFAPERSSNISTALYDSLTLEQTMDLGDANFALNNPNSQIQEYLNMLEAVGGAKFYACYEGGPGWLGLGGTLDTSNHRSESAVLHPRMRGQYLAYLNGYEPMRSQPNGAVRMELFNQYMLADIYGTENGYPKDYGCFKGTAQAPGRGDGTDGLADSRPHLVDANGIAQIPVQAFADGNGGATVLPSVMGGAIAAWNGVVVPGGGSGGGTSDNSFKRPRGWTPRLARPTHAKALVRRLFRRR